MSDANHLMVAAQGLHICVVWRNQLVVSKIVNVFKRLARSGDIRFSFGLGKPGERHTLRWKNHRVTYRSKSSDLAQIERLLLLGERCEYNLPKNINPRYILDAGSNIGLAALFFSEYFPNAKIICCEPASDNFELLRLNTDHLPNVAILRCGLGKRNTMGRVVKKRERNYANLRVIEDDAGDTPIYNYSGLLKASGMASFDLIKIDIEGNEYDFMSSVTDSDLAECKWIVGEVHSTNEWLLLNLLSKHFAIDIRKTMGKRASKFHGCNLARQESFLKNFDVSILQK
jgi:FkbM family methyltransferase